MASSTHPPYEILHETAPNIRLVRRRADNTVFVAYPWENSDPLDSLLRRGAATATSALLCHPNLISFIDTIPMDAFHGGGWKRRTGSIPGTTTNTATAAAAAAAGGGPQRCGKKKEEGEGAPQLAVWDYCDAGTLETFLSKTTRRVSKDETTGKVLGWMPESLCWHVVMGLLGALGWLHEGWAELDVAIYGDDRNEDGEVQPRREPRSYTALATRDNEDWMPILHRAVTVENVWFQQPRGSETYGLCKLGNFAKAFVSGHVNDFSRGATVVCSEDGKSSLAEVKRDMAVGDVYLLPKGKRPYTRGTEIYHVGAILYRMMTGRILPDKEECSMPGCSVRHWHDESNETCVFACSQDIDGTTKFILRNKIEPLKPFYTSQLIAVLEALLSKYRADAHAPTLLYQAKQGYLKWKREEVAGREYCDAWDDRVLRQRNRERVERETRELAMKQSGKGAVDFEKFARGVQRVAEEKVEEVRLDNERQKQLVILEGLGK